jgi:hypothetical protein
LFCLACVPGYRLEIASDHKVNNAPAVIGASFVSVSIAPPETVHRADTFSPRHVAGVARNYYDAVDRNDYGRAYCYWGDDGSSSGHTLEAVKHSFARLISVSVATGERSRIEGAARSRYITIDPPLFRYSLPVKKRNASRERISYAGP